MKMQIEVHVHYNFVFHYCNHFSTVLYMGRAFHNSFSIEESLNLQLKCVRAFTIEPFGISSESGGRLMFSPEYKMHF